MKYKILKDAIISKFGKDIADSSSAKNLIISIANETGEEVSYNTIRRFFGLIDHHQSNYHLKTINILSRYCGFKNYSDQEKHYASFKSWKLINTIGFSKNKIEKFDEIVKELEKLISIDSSSLLYLAILTDRLLLQSNEEQLVQLYNIKIENIYEENMLMQVTNCCNLFANNLRNYTFKDRNNLLQLSKKETFVRLYLHHFIDYGVNQNYIDLLENTDDSIFNSTDLAYKYLYLDRYYFLIGDKKNVTFKGIDIPFSQITVDFVRGRWIASTYMKDPSRFNFDMFMEKGMKSILLATEVLVFALIENDFSTIEKVCSYYDFENIKSLAWHNTNEKIILELFLILNAHLKNKTIQSTLQGTNIEENSNFQCLEYNTAIFLYIQTIIEGDSPELKEQFEIVKRKTYLYNLDYQQAVRLHISLCLL